MREVEQEIFGADHQAFGKALCEKWKFPESFAQVTGFHHNPLDLPTGARSMACLVHIADRLASSLEGAFRLDLPSLDIDGSILDEIKLTRDSLEEVRSRLAEEVEEVAAMLA
jgi:HD-like signal output (HDOD) protein